MFARDDYDVITIGGGPGGAAAATLVAKAGWRTLLVERSAEPRFKIGESLMPATYWTLERMGALEKMKRSHFVKKYSVQFFSKSGKGSAPFYFQEVNPHESAMTWQVLRSEFDALLLENAAEQGVEVRRGVNVRDVLFEDGRVVGVRVQLPDGAEKELRCRVVVDASGQAAFLGRKLNLLKPDPELRKAAFYSHFEGAYRDSGIDEGATLVIHTENQESWFWYIPLPNDRVSVGVVGSVDYLVAGREGTPQQIFDEEVAKSRVVEERIAGARQAFPIQATRDFSYRSSRVAGDGWVLVGDAFGFLDPIYSSGVLLALKSGELAADSIAAALRAGDPSAERLGAHGPGFAAGMEQMRRLVYAYYEQDFSFGKFMRRHPECRGELIHMLVGDVFQAPYEQLFTAMAEMCPLPEAQPYSPVAETAAVREAARD